MMHTVRAGLAAPVLILALAAASVASAQPQLFSGGSYVVPETISLAPPEFGSYGGSYFIPDAGLGIVWTVPATGGPPVSFLPEPIFGGSRGGMFLPAGWGSHSGKFLTAGLTVNAYDSAGSGTSFLGIQPDETELPVVVTANFTTPLIAPDGFGAFAGNLFVSDFNNRIWRMDATEQLLHSFRYFQGTVFEALAPFGMQFTPPGFGPGGAFGDRLLVSNADYILDAQGRRVSEIIAVQPDGTAEVFTTIPLKGLETDPDQARQDGLRQMLLTPPDYLVPVLGADGAGQMLLVSVSGSGAGGGALGEVLALNSAGEIMAHLVVGTAIDKFDPRGMFITADGELLISDASDPIWLAGATDFAPGRGGPIPEPSTVLLLALGCAGLRLVSRRRTEQC